MIYSIVCTILWATTGIFVKSIQNLPISSILLSRFFIAGIFLVLLNNFIKNKNNFKEQSQTSTTLTMVLALFMTLYYFTATYAFVYTPVALATLLMSMSPCVVIIYKVIKKEKVKKFELLGFMIATLGILLYIFPSFHNTNNHSHLALGCFLAFSAAIFKAVNSQIIWNKKDILTEFDFKKINLTTFFFASIISSFTIINVNQTIQITAKNIILMIALGILATALPSVLNNLASSKIDPIKHTVIGMLTPLISGVFAWLFLAEKLSSWSILSLFISIIGVMIITLFSQNSKT